MSKTAGWRITRSRSKSGSRSKTKIDAAKSPPRVQLGHKVRSGVAEYPRSCRSHVPRRAIPCSELAQQRHNIIRKRVALVAEESVSVVTGGTAPAQPGEPTHAHLHHWQ